MKPNQLRSALDKLDLTQVELARLFGRRPRSVQRWIAGDRAMPPEAVILTRLLLVGKISAEDLRALLP